MKRLKELALARSRERYPNFPENARVIHRYTDKTANGLTRCIVDFLNFSGHQAERISTSGRYIDTRQTYVDSVGFNRTIGSGKWIPGQGTKGSADLSATIYGKSVKIEIKMKDKMSPDQHKYAESIRRAGGIYFVAHSFDEFLTHYDAIVYSSSQTQSVIA